MIPANELRIGNWVNVPNEKQCPFRIDAFEFLSNIDYKVAMDNGTYYVEGFGEVPNHPLTWHKKDLLPIPLTPEILEKCGTANGASPFKDQLAYYFKSNTNTILWCGGFLFKKITEDRFIFICDERVEYLHTLQNAIFALTGKELEIKM